MPPALASALFVCACRACILRCISITCRLPSWRQNFTLQAPAQGYPLAAKGKQRAADEHMQAYFENYQGMKTSSNSSKTKHIGLSGSEHSFALSNGRASKLLGISKRKPMRTYLSQTHTLTRFTSFLPSPPVLILPFSCCLSSKSCIHVSPNSQWAISSDAKDARGLLRLGVQAPPSGPVYPSVHLQSLALALPGKEELPGRQARHEAFDTAPTTAE